MKKLWEGRNSSNTNPLADKFNSSIAIDKRMYREDIEASIAHVNMLGKCGIIPVEESQKIAKELVEIREEINEGKLVIDENAEDIHMFVEAELTKRLGDVGKKLHTARSRNDQVAVDERVYLLRITTELLDKIKTFVKVLVKLSENNKETLMPGYTHMQRAQGISYGHYILTYAWMLIRDYDRFTDLKKRIAINPLGSGALAGTTHAIDRALTTSALGFLDYSYNSLDGVSDRDFIIEFMSDASIMSMHLSRLAEEIIIWNSQEFSFIEIDSAFTTGSSIMPQKKNPDMAELVRGKTGRVYGNLLNLLVCMKGLPLAYNKDMQEDKEALFDTIDTIFDSLDIMTLMLESIKVKKDRLLEACKDGFINATDLADYLVKKGLPFREAYKISGRIVADCVEKKQTLLELPLDAYKTYSELFESDLYQEIEISTCVNKRKSGGGTAPENVDIQINKIKEKLNF